MTDVKTDNYGIVPEFFARKDFFDWIAKRGVHADDVKFDFHTASKEERAEFARRVKEADEARFREAVNDAMRGSTSALNSLWSLVKSGELEKSRYDEIKKYYSGEKSYGDWNDD
ncbi:hypothetical protein GPY51_21365 [Photorhabdus laumondii subsp. laumondii]|uniref:Uncharacterized protein n=1 Tax=Photorhabdus laumondii subsp. laumondii TaxID=141679 RepID=A0A6L9JPM7_PHOLM|nr:hypothetical protein [Photorhabdus laumondii]AWK42609.1 hypothetical protein A4R40_14475 [Photorhabdus laumondii subsp. laumondii]AXG47934.1 hypothetical protein PluTT01m_14895 [Photorhabdus laumondii subsp. laumondii]MCC8384953.1 hypothetical protein [Photorhabdus laumondii]MCC8413659.1 hypothetical protein [Photorhabdus laumondii]NDK96821.1 hypothetical protein [Photorhabdus laumondii subsp. laumondii]